jgi:Glycosyl transferases group 1/Glycosyltransferase Family 4
VNVLWVATKAPWPPVDGGRLLLLNTLRALSAAGHRLTLVAPIDAGGADPGAAAALEPWCRPSLVAVRKRPLVVDLLRSQLARTPLTLVRHAHPALRRRVRDHLRDEAFDLVLAEQVQALDAALRGDRPVVLRAQNVESDLWAQAARHALWRRPALALEARRLAAREGRAVRRCAATVALTAEDAERLGALAGAAAKVHHVPAPFEPELPAAQEPLPGSPPVVLFGSGGWRPNAAGAEWFLRRAWPRMRSARPQAILHVFGIAAAGDGIVSHPAPADSRAAYPQGGVLAVPLGIASGVRIKILEAWARGSAVIATPEAARGLDAEDGEQLLLARDGDEFAAALSRLADAELTARLIAAGRRHLRRHHDASRVARRLTEIYREVTR